jgi:hypothetical protein
MHSSRRFEPEMAGFVVLNQLALGRRDAIEAPLAELRSLMSVSINLRSVENLALLQEVEAEIAHYAAQ